MKRLAFPFESVTTYIRSNFPANIRDHEIGFSDFSFDLRVKNALKSLTFPFESVPFYIRSNFLVYIRDHEIGFSDFSSVFRGKKSFLWKL